MRVTWKDKATSMEVYFTKKTADKTQVVVQHTKIPEAKAADKMKTYWTKKLDRLRTTLE
ncbi:MAG: SRPBCC domain-containing protein [Acidobacteriota bacterium]|nr:SRPBCC domain-containing protein [Acidobacteriota bacterium]